MRRSKAALTIVKSCLGVHGEDFCPHPEKCTVECEIIRVRREIDEELGDAETNRQTVSYDLEDDDADE